MEPFKKDVKCPKCGLGDSTEGTMGIRHVQGDESNPEHIVRTCTYCSYQLKQLPVNAQES